MSRCFVLSRGQAHPSGGSTPYFGPSLKLDFELEMVSLLLTHIFVAIYQLKCIFKVLFSNYTNQDDNIVPFSSLYIVFF